MKAPVFNCPQCDTTVEGRADYIARGMKCPQCGIGFMPVKVEPRRQIGGKEPAWLRWVVVAILILAALPLLYFFWPLAVVLLLATFVWGIRQLKRT